MDLFSASYSVMRCDHTWRMLKYYAFEKEIQLFFYFRDLIYTHTNTHIQTKLLIYLICKDRTKICMKILACLSEVQYIAVTYI